MKTTSFLDKIAFELLKEPQKILNSLIVLPNKRAKVFLENALRKKAAKPMFSPKMLSIDEFMQEVSGIKNIDKTILLFEFYKVYLENTPTEEHQSFETFSNWAKTFMNDCNEIDQYLIDTNHLFSYLIDIERIKQWKVEPLPNDLIEKHLAFWRKMPVYYYAFYSHLIAKKQGYQGLIYREATKKRIDYSQNTTYEQIYFVGLNALTKAEDTIIYQLVTQKKATVFWDFDSFYIDDLQHEAGFFARKNLKNFNLTKDTTSWIEHNFSSEKNIQIIGTPKSIGQAKIIGNILAKIPSTEHSRTALVLSEEQLLLPVLHSLPNFVENVNITMGYSTRNNPIERLFSVWFKMHQAAQKRNAKTPVFYFKDVIDLLTHPLVVQNLDTRTILSEIQQNNITFITETKLLSLCKENSLLFNYLFLKLNSTEEAINQAINLIIYLKESLENNQENDKLSLPFLYAIYKILIQIQNYQSEYKTITTLETLQGIYKNLIDFSSVSFEGEPLTGLQIMGVLESRTLDFDTVIIASLNEGVFPKANSNISYIPLDVRREVGLPTYKENEALFSYHFYRLISRAKNIYLVYNTENDGLDSGEKSRFITQIEIDGLPQHQITHKIFQPKLPNHSYQPLTVEKTDEIIEILTQKATDSGFSPTFLTTYIRNPIQFYFQKVLKINEVEEVEENIEVNTLGTIIHRVLEFLYTPLIDKTLTINDINKMIKNIDSVVLQFFTEIYKEGDIKKGKNLLSFQVAKRTVYNFLLQEKIALEKGDLVTILGLEQTFERVLVDKRLPIPIKIQGNIDRIELRNNSIRIIDYKTGRVEENNLKITNFEGLTTDTKYEKVIQLLCYAFLYEEFTKNYPLEVGIISFKNLSAGFMPFGTKIHSRDKNPITNITPEILENFKTELICLINNIFDKDAPFIENIL